MNLSLSRKTLAVIPLLALLAGACVKPDAPGIDVSPISARLVFGLPPEKPEAPSNPLVPPSFDDFDNGDDGFDFGPEPEPLPPITLPPPKVEFCPQAPPTAAVEKPTEVTITGDPLEGLTRWKVDGFRNNASVPRSYEGRIVRNFKEVPPDLDPRHQAGDKLTQFEMVQPLAGQENLFLVSTYEVRTTTLQNRPGAPAGPVQPPTVGQPERGVVLKRLDLVDGNGSAAGNPWSPPSGVLLLPLPVTSGETFQSSAVDPKNGRTIAVNGTVQFRSRIDACGDLVDGWLVDTEMFDSSQPTTEILKYSFVVATQFGGQLISERFTLGGESAIFELGQLKPTAI